LEVYLEEEDGWYGSQYLDVDTTPSPHRAEIMHVDGEFTAGLQDITISVKLGYGKHSLHFEEDNTFADYVGAGMCGDKPKYNHNDGFCKDMDELFEAG
jgi:hypothetical protein